MIWTAIDVAEFIKRVLPPGETLHGYDDRILFSEAKEIAEYEGDDGALLMDALLEMETISSAEACTKGIIPSLHQKLAN